MASEVNFYNDAGESITTINVQVADDDVSRHVGLSDTESLGPSEGMLFLYPDEDERSFVMRDMNFDLDIIMIDSEGIITDIHEAPVENNQTERTLTEYKGLAQAVVEVPMGFSADNEIEVGYSVDVILVE